MFSLNQTHRYYMYGQPTDMRKGFDGLSGLIRSKLKCNPLSGDVYIFINRQRNRMKLLVWETGGFVLYYKRLERGTFEFPKCQNQSTISLSWQDLLFIVQGIQLASVRRRKRFTRA